MKNAHEVRIWIKPSDFMPKFKMVIAVPNDCDDEEYIDDLLEAILRDCFWCHTEWDFDT